LYSVLQCRSDARRENGRLVPEVRDGSHPGIGLEPLDFPTNADPLPEVQVTAVVCDLVREEPDDNTAKLAVILDVFSFSVDPIVLVGDGTFEIANSSCRIMVQNCLFEDIECVALIARDPSPETFGRKIDVSHWTFALLFFHEADGCEISKTSKSSNVSPLNNCALLQLGPGMAPIP